VANPSADAIKPGHWSRVAQWLGLAIVAVVLAIAADVRFYLELSILEEQGIAFALGCALAVVFLEIRATGDSDFGRTGRLPAVPFYDVIFAALAFVAATWLAFRFQIISAAFFEHRTECFVLSLVIVPLVFEALRRTAGWALVAVLGIFMVYGLFGDLIPGILQARAPGFFKLFAYLSGDNVALLGLPLKIIVTIVVMFMVMGQLLTRSGGSEWFIDISMSLMGRARGGPAKIAILASALFGSISGSAVSNVASTGQITIPLMKKGGYSPTSAGAFEAVASTGGQIMPPVMGAAAFLMAEYLEVTYAQVILAALVPAVLYYVAVFVQADLEAARHKIAALEGRDIEPVGRVLARGWYFLLPFAVLIVALFQFNRTPSEAALWASLVLLAVGLRGYKKSRLGPVQVIESLRAAGNTSVSIITFGAMAGLIIGLIEVTGLSFGLTFLLVQVGEQSLILLLILTGLVAIILGMSMPTTAIYVLLAVLAAPRLIKLGVDPFAAHLFVLYYGLLSLITPPVAIAAFTGATLAQAPPMATAVYAVRYGWPAFVLPFAFVLSPGLILQADWFEAVRAVLAACLGIWVISLGIGGWFVRPLTLFMRLALTLGGACLLFPSTVPQLPWLDLAGLVISVVVMGWEMAANGRTKVRPAGDN
jgi:TRAP transporter 4TM/12TM fusion protein